MTLLSILITLTLDLLSELYKEHRQLRWYDDFVERLRERHDGPWLQGGTGVLLLAGGPALVAHLLDNWLGHLLFGLGGLAISVLVLYVCLGPLAPLRELDAYLKARREGNEELQNDRARRLLGEQPPVAAGARDRAVLRACLASISEHMVAVLFWFVLLGPLGAVLYRATVQLAHRITGHHPGAGGLEETAAQLQGLLDWVPVRLVGMGYALTGSFDRGFARLSAAADGQNGMHADGRQRLADTGMAALELDPNASEVSEQGLLAGRRLMARSLWINLGALALLTLLDWVA